MNISPSESMRPNKAQLNAGPKLKDQQLVIPELKRLQQQELQAQQMLTINKPVKQIARQAANPTAEPRQKKASNRLEAPYKKPSAKPTHKKGANRLEAPYTKPNPTKPGRPSAELKNQKQEMLDWLNNVRIG